MSSRGFGIVVGVDGSPRSAVAVSWAARDAELRNVPLTLVHAAPRRWAAGRGNRVHRILNDALAVAESSRRAGGPPKLITKIASTNPVATLVELSRDAELLVVGARGRRSGSISSRVVGRSHCAVAVIHDADPLMPLPSQAPVLLGVDSTGHAHRQARRQAGEEARRRGVALIEAQASVDGLVRRSEAAQLVVVGDRVAGAAVARAARMPVIVTE